MNNDEQGDDGCADGDNVVQPQKTERNKQGERSFRAVGRGAERVLSVDRNALERPNFLGALFAGRQGLADDAIEIVHRAGTAFSCVYICYEIGGNGIAYTEEVLMR